MFERILVPLDGSPAAEAGLPAVEEWARRFESEVLLLRAYQTELVGGFEHAVMTVEIRKQAEAYLEEVRRRLEGSGIRARAFAVWGDAAWTIVEVALREEASLIAMTTHGRSGLARWVFGSVTERVLRASTTPVLVTRSFARGEDGAPALRAIRRILLPLDGSSMSRAVLPAVVELSRLHGARVLVLRVIAEAEGEAVAREEVQPLTARLAAEGVEGEVLIRRGDPAGEIVDAAEEVGADLLAMTTHGRSGPSRWALGSVTEKVIRAAQVPLLVVRAGPAPRALSKLAAAQEEV